MKILFKLIWHFAIAFALFFPVTEVVSAEFIIYSIVQDIPMGHENEVVKKNYYVNIGQNQGVRNGTSLNVVRLISRQDPYESKRRFNYNVNIGKLKVIHAEEKGSVTVLEKFDNGPDSPLYEIDNFMIGDKVEVSID
jgi:hypothetical protein